MKKGNVKPLKKEDKLLLKRIDAFTIMYYKRYASNFIFEVWYFNVRMLKEFYSLRRELKKQYKDDESFKDSLKYLPFNAFFLLRYFALLIYIPVAIKLFLMGYEFCSTYFNNVKRLPGLFLIIDIIILLAMQYWLHRKSENIFYALSEIRDKINPPNHGF